MSQQDFLRRVVDALESAGIPYMLTGSYASSYYGTPRSTQDLDLVIAPSEESLTTFLRSFPHDQFYASEDAAADALKRKGQFNVIESRSAWKADLIILKGRPFSQREFLRRSKATVLGVPLEIVSPEDLILAKLEWSAEGGSKRQIEDAAGVLRTRRDKLDWDYLKAGVAELGLEPEWSQAWALAGLKT